jgi:hypothetical protein
MGDVGRRIAEMWRVLKPGGFSRRSLRRHHFPEGGALVGQMTLPPDRKARVTTIESGVSPLGEGPLLFLSDNQMPELSRQARSPTRTR